MESSALKAIAAGAVLGVVVAMSGGHADADPFAAMSALRVVPPAPAPDVSFRTLDGSATRLADLRGRPVVLTFFTTW